MKRGDLVKFTGTWAVDDMPKTGIVMETWTIGRTRKLSSVDVAWDNGKIENMLAHRVKVISD